MDWAGEDLREAILWRSGGVCECCGQTRYESLHHRTPRGMGGSTDPALNSSANIVAVCGHGTAGCHGRVEVGRAIATRYGWLVPHGSNPETTPILYRGLWAYLTAENGVDYLQMQERSGLPDSRAWRERMRIEQKRTHR